MAKAVTPNYKRMFKCDEFRIEKFPGKMFLILGWKRNTKDDAVVTVVDGVPTMSSRWLKNGELYDFDYLQEQVVANGGTEKELLKNAKEYKRVSRLTSGQYLGELLKRKKRK